MAQNLVNKVDVHLKDLPKNNHFQIFSKTTKVVMVVDRQCIAPTYICMLIMNVVIS